MNGTLGGMLVGAPLLPGHAAPLNATEPSALLTYRTAAALLGQMFPVDAGQDPETLRRHTFKITKILSMTSAAEAPVSVDAKAIVVTLDSTFIRSCEDGERHLEVR